MLEAIASTPNQKSEVARRQIQVVLNVLGNARAFFLVPPVEELKEVRSFHRVPISVREVASETAKRQQVAFADELKKLYSKHARFQKSAIYLNRLANLSELSGDVEGARAFLADAIQIQPDVSLIVKLGDSLAQENRLSEARKILLEVAGKGDTKANLRLAYMGVMEGNLTGAEECIWRSLRMNPTDYESRLFAGTVCLVRNQFEMAIRHFRVAEGERRNSAALYVNLAVAQVCLGHLGKALKSLRTAVAINPFSENAVAFLADLAFSENKNELSVGPLEQYSKYEQKQPQMWARLGRAQHALRQFDSAIKAVKAEAALRPASSPFNNIGVSYWGKGDLEKALQFFNVALEQDPSKDKNGYHIALKNSLAVLLKMGKANDALRRSEKAIQDDEGHRMAADKVFSVIYLNNLDALLQLEQHEVFVERSNAVLSWEQSAPSLRIGVLTGLIFYFTLVNPNLPVAINYSEEVLRSIDSGLECDERARVMALNNAAYTFIETNRLDDAGRVLNRLSQYVHKDAYPTATLGLFHLRRGHLDRGESLYREAIDLVADPRLRVRFEQKLNLELGQIYLSRGETALGTSLLIKAGKETKGLRMLKIAANAAMALLPNKESKS